MSPLKSINPNWYGTLEFLAGLVKEPEFLRLVEELNRQRTAQRKFNQKEDSSREWNNLYLNYLRLTGRCLAENNSVPSYGKHRHIDDFIDACQEISGELEGRSVAKVIALILNSDLKFGRKVRKVDEISEHFYWLDWEFRLHDEIPFQKGQIGEKGAESVVRTVQESFRKGSKKKYSPRYVYDLSLGIEKTEKVVSLLRTSFSSSASCEEEFYFALLVGESLDSEYWVKIMDKLPSFDSVSIYVREMWDCTKRNLVKKGEEAVQPLIQALTFGFYSQIDITRTAPNNFLELTSLLIELFRSNLPGKYDVALTRIDSIEHLINDPLWIPIINGLRAAYRKKDYIVTVLGEIGEPAVKPLVELLDSNYPEKFYAARALGEILAYEREHADSDAVNSLVNYLSSEDPYCYYAAIALGEIRSSAAVGGLVNFLYSYHPQKNCALPALGKIGDFKAIEPLVKYIKQEKDEFNISSAVNALSMINDLKAREYLTSFVRQHPRYLSNLEERVSSLEDLDGPSWISVLKKEFKIERGGEGLDIPF